MDTETQGSQGGVKGINRREDGCHEIILCVESRRGSKIGGRWIKAMPSWTRGEVATGFKGYRNIVIACLWWRERCQQTLQLKTIRQTMISFTSSRLTDRLTSSLVDGVHGEGGFEVKKRFKEKQPLWPCSSSGGTCMRMILMVWRGKR